MAIDNGGCRLERPTCFDRGVTFADLNLEDVMTTRLTQGDSKEEAASFAYKTLALPMLTGTFVTIAGFVLDLAGEIPAAGTTYTYRDWTFRVQSIEKRRISEIVIEYHKPPEVELPSVF